MADLPLHPRLAHMVLTAREHGAGPTAVAAAALLGTRSAAQKGTDFSRRLAEPVIGEAERVRRQLARLAGVPPGAVEPALAGVVLSLAFPERIGRARPDSRGLFLLAGGRGARLDPRDVLAAEPWLAVVELDDLGTDARIRLAAPLAESEVRALHASRVETVEEVRYDVRTEAVLARELTRLGAIMLAERPLAPDPDRLARALCDGIRQGGIDRLRWSDTALQLRARVALLRRSEPESWPDLSDRALAADLETWLAPYLAGLRRVGDVARLDLAGILRQHLGHARERELARRAPERVTVPSGRTHPIDYTADPPVLAVKLQELFGLAATPAVDGGRIPLTLHLLSPAQRPLAVTQDLGSFWANTYPAVRRELRGRYPKHPWPEDPRGATPTHRVAKAAG
jgi:ATP-dependent helicase HrpB